MLIWTSAPRGVSLSGPPYVRPLSQGSNPWADIGCMAAIRIIADNLERAVTDPTDIEARHQMMFAALLAGISFGNSGVHLPHAMSCTDSSLQACHPLFDSVCIVCGVRCRPVRCP